jgi:hypothetical protein
MRPGTLARNSNRDAKGASMNTSANGSGEYVAWLGIFTLSSVPFVVTLTYPSRFR